MENRELENKISSVICDIVPEDSFDKISERIAKGDVPERSNVKMNKGSKIRRVLFPVVAACIFLIVSVVFGLTYYGNNYAVESIIDIDVNPSIEISVNKKDKVLGVVALNDDAKAIIEGMTFDKCDVNLVVDAIMSKLVEAGYVVSDAENGILITVQNEDIKEADRVRSKVVDKIDKHLMDKNIDADVMGQSLSNVDEAKKFAEENDISVGRAMFIKKLSEKHKDIDPEELADMPMKDIVREVKHKKIELDGIVDCDPKGDKHNGNPHENGKDHNQEVTDDDTDQIEVKISEDEAKNIAVTDAGAEEADVVFKNIKLDYKKDTLVYKVIFCVENTEYCYEISAVDGTVLKSNTTSSADSLDSIPDKKQEHPFDAPAMENSPGHNVSSKPDNRPVDGNTRPDAKPDNGGDSAPDNNTTEDESILPENGPTDGKPTMPEKNHGESEFTKVENQAGMDRNTYQDYKR